MAHPQQPEPHSFGYLLKGITADFVSREGLSCLQTGMALSEAIVTVGRYREEGRALFPQVFICANAEAAQKSLQARHLLEIGEGRRGAETMRRAIKKCAPLACNGWAVFVELIDGNKYRYGLFRSSNFALAPAPIEVLKTIGDPTQGIIAVRQLAENVVEVVGASGKSAVVRLSDEDRDTPLPTDAVARLADAITQDVGEDDREQTRSFYERVLFELLQSSHGALVAVVEDLDRNSALFRDGTRIPSIDIAAAIRRYRADAGEENVAQLRSLVTLVQGMFGSDGITIFNTAGAVLGFNYFIGHKDRKDAPMGGARRRTYTELTLADPPLAAAFYRSQDGRAECWTRPAKQPSTPTGALPSPAADAAADAAAPNPASPDPVAKSTTPEPDVAAESGDKASVEVVGDRESPKEKHES